MRWKTRWIPLAVLIAIGCDNTPLAPDDSTPPAAAVTTEQIVAHETNWQQSDTPRWLQLRPDGLYDDRGMRRLSSERVRQLGIDRAFELHRQTKTVWLKERQKAVLTVGTSSTVDQRMAPAGKVARARTVSPGIARRLTVPISPRLAVASDDPCFFDASIWCSNEYGGELGGGGAAVVEAPTRRVRRVTMARSAVALLSRA